MAQAPVPLASNSFYYAAAITPDTTVLHPPAGNGATAQISIAATTTQPLPLRVTQMLATSTTATGIIGFW